MNTQDIFSELYDNNIENHVICVGVLVITTLYQGRFVLLPGFDPVRGRGESSPFWLPPVLPFFLILSPRYREGG